jgi:hypothetical protein
MRLFECQACGNLLHFENRTCQQCGHGLAYLPEVGKLSALEPDATGVLMALAKTDQPRVFCANAQYDACNWLLPPNSTGPLCLACRHNHIIPDLSQADNVGLWQLMENAKHRLFYSLLRWRLPLKTLAEDPQHGLSFDFLADMPAPTGPKVMTGHASGRITIALDEADDAEREKRREAMKEPYRTLLGHFRHEIGHYYWDVLVRDGGPLDACRALFGDERMNYSDALNRHYADGAPADWQQHYVSEYAATHPYEDFAETWAHYLHIVDTLEMVGASGMSVRLGVDRSGERTARVDFDPYSANDIHEIVDSWLPFVFAINSVCRAMGEHDFYPFVLAPGVIDKLGFVHGLIHSGQWTPNPAVVAQ